MARSYVYVKGQARIAIPTPVPHALEELIPHDSGHGLIGFTATIYGKVCSLSRDMGRVALPADHAIPVFTPASRRNRDRSHNSRPKRLQLAHEGLRRPLRRGTIGALAGAGELFGREVWGERSRHMADLIVAVTWLAVTAMLLQWGWLILRMLGAWFSRLAGDTGRHL